MPKRENRQLFKKTDGGIVFTKHKQYHSWLQEMVR